MPTYKQILFPIDLAEEVEGRLRYVRDLARQLKAQLHLLYVVREFDFARGIFIPHENVDRMEDEYRSAAQKKMESVRAENFPDDPGVTAAVAFGSPAEEILRYAKEKGIDLIALFTHSQGRIEHAIFGSVAEKVVKGAKVPVLTIRPQNL